MNSRSITTLLAATVLGVAILSAPRANAVSMHVVPSSIHQVEFTAGIALGHTVTASTNMNHLNAGGAFEARCPSPLLLPIRRNRSLPAQVIFGGAQLYVTIPEVVQTTIDMLGFENLPDGTTLSCSYDWTAAAEDSSYTLGFGGFSFAYGGDKITDAGNVPFEMYKPGSDASTKQGCIH